MKNRVPVSIVDRHSTMTVAEAFAGITAGVTVMKEFRVERPDAATLVVVKRYLPGWAFVLGVLGLVVFLLGIAFFFVRTEDRLTIVANSAPDGARFTVTGFTDSFVAEFVDDFLSGG